MIIHKQDEVQIHANVSESHRMSIKAHLLNREEQKQAWWFSRTQAELEETADYQEWQPFSKSHSSTAHLTLWASFYGLLGLRLWDRLQCWPHIVDILVYLLYEMQISSFFSFLPQSKTMNIRLVWESTLISCVCALWQQIDRMVFSNTGTWLEVSGN